MRAPRTSCLINNHNYAQYVCEAVESALAQESPFDEIIVVDDGSTDESLNCLRKRFGTTNHLQIISKEQGGQLSCIQQAISVATGDLVFFLDSDDLQQRTLTQEVQQVYQAKPSVDFVSVGYQPFGPCTKKQRRKTRVTRDRGVSTVAAIFHREWVGAPTSCLSMRSGLLRQILPYPRTSQWQTRADDVLVLGSSIVGAHKYHLESPLIEYRLHGKNHFAGRTWTETDKMRYSLELNRMIHWYIEKMGYEMLTLPRLSPKEFRTIESPQIKELTRYLCMAMHYSLPWNVRLGNVISALRHYTKERIRSRPKGLPAGDSVVPISSQASAKVQDAA